MFVVLCLTKSFNCLLTLFLVLQISLCVILRVSLVALLGNSAGIITLVYHMRNVADVMKRKRNFLCTI